MGNLDSDCVDTSNTWPNDSAIMQQECKTSKQQMTGSGVVMVRLLSAAAQQQPLQHFIVLSKYVEHRHCHQILRIFQIKFSDVSRANM